MSLEAHFEGLQISSKDQKQKSKENKKEEQDDK
jgi:hypothetical protein